MSLPGYREARAGLVCWDPVCNSRASYRIGIARATIGVDVIDLMSQGCPQCLRPVAIRASRLSADQALVSGVLVTYRPVSRIEQQSPSYS